MKKQTILIFDNEAFMIDLLTDIFSNEFYILSASNTNKSIQLLTQHAISLIISNTVMPDMTSVHFCKYVKSNPNFSHIPILMLIEQIDAEIQLDQHLIADAYIEKPFSPAVLKTKATNLLQNRNDTMRLRDNNLYPSQESKFIEQLHRLIDAHINDPLFDLAFLASKLYMSRASLYRKIKALSSFTPHEIVEQRRLKRATELIQLNQYKMNEIALMSGYKSPSQFTKSFKRKFGQSPLNYARLHK